MALFGCECVDDEFVVMCVGTSFLSAVKHYTSREKHYLISFIIPDWNRRIKQEYDYTSNKSLFDSANFVKGRIEKNLVQMV